jgi:hypothetical protein
MPKKYFASAFRVADFTVAAFIVFSSPRVEGFERSQYPDPALGKVTATCRAPKNSPKKVANQRVYFFKQWHLPPEANTRLKPGPHPQDSNLESIYLQLDRWIEERKIQSVIAEGCTGMLDESSSYSVNGWTVKDLQAEVPKPGFSKITTSVPLKLEARHGSTLSTLCGEKEGLVKEQLLGFSDARADVGYLSRILQYQKDPVRLKPYLADVVDLFKLPKGTTAPQAAAAIKKDLKKTLQGIRETLDKRNRSLVDAILASKAQDVAVVYGGMHADGVKTLLEKRGIECLIIEPTDYQNNEADLLKQLELALKKL